LFLPAITGGALKKQVDSELAEEEQVMV